MKGVLARLGEPQRKFQVVLVGGTNGKGSTASALARMVQAEGIPVGLFTSPHLQRVNERFVMNGVCVEDAVLDLALQQVRREAEAVGATFFEAMTAVACVLFAEAGVDMAVMEVGMGGRFDATNALEPKLSIITSVDLDHTQVLGETVTQIARDKAGIMRPHTLCLTGAQGLAESALRDEANKQQVPLWSIGQALRSEVQDLGWQGVRVVLETPLDTIAFESSLVGRHQGDNLALAAAAGQVLGLSTEAIILGAKRVQWPGRLEPIISDGYRFLLDGAHNPAAARVLAGMLKALRIAPVTLMFAVSRDKDLAAIVAALAPVTCTVILAQTSSNARAYAPPDVAEVWARFGVEVACASDVREALEQVKWLARADQTVVVAGSLYLVGEVRALLLDIARTP